MDSDKLNFISTDATAQSRKMHLTQSFLCWHGKVPPLCAAFAHCVLDAFESGKKLCKGNTVGCL